ncbi:hypothetical protein F2P56_023837, partial [Juglans regia]
MGMFRNLMEEGNLFDLGWRGNKFTWCNRHEDESFTKEKLDRAIANCIWRAKYPKVSVETSLAVCSDHNPILLQCSSDRPSIHSFHTFFQYEASWNKEDGCSVVVSEAWQGRNGMESGLDRVISKLETTKNGLKQWSKNLARDRTKAIRDKTQLIKSRLIAKMQQQLDRAFIEKDVEVVLMHMSPFKSPGPDGFSA